MKSLFWSGVFQQTQALSLIDLNDRQLHPGRKVLLGWMKILHHI